MGSQYSPQEKKKNRSTIRLKHKPVFGTGALRSTIDPIFKKRTPSKKNKTSKWVIVRSGRGHQQTRYQCWRRWWLRKCKITPTGKEIVREDCLSYISLKAGSIPAKSVIWVWWGCAFLAQGLSWGAVKSLVGASQMKVWLRLKNPFANCWPKASVSHWLLAESLNSSPRGPLHRTS